MTDWISVEKEPPDDDTGVVWVYGRFWDGADFREKRQVDAGEFCASSGWRDDYGDAILVTHYQPYTRPEPPEEAKS